MILQKVRKFVVLFLLSLNCLFVHQIQAQLEVISVGDRKLSLEGVISQGRISDVVEDKEGLIWVGTLDGLNSYDGYNAVVYRNIEGDTTSLSNNIVNSLQVCCDNSIWVATNHGLNKLNTQTGKFEVFLESDTNFARLNANQIIGIDVDSKSNVWMATAGAGIVKFDTRNNTREYVTLGKCGVERVNQVVTELSVDKSDNVWFANRTGQVARYNSSKDTIEFFKVNGRRDNNATFFWVGEIFTDRNNKIWFALTGYYHGIYHFDEKSGEIVENKEINDLIDSDPRFTTSLYLVNSFFDGKNGSLWFASGYLGIFNLESNNKVKVYVDKMPAAFNFDYYKNNLGTSVMYISSTGILWKGTNGYSLEYFPDLKSMFNTVRPDKINSVKGPSSIRAFEEDENNLYVGGYYSLLIYDKKRSEYSTLETNASFYTLCKNPLNPNELIIGTEGGGVIFYNIETQCLTDEDKKVFSPTIDGGNVVFELNAQGDSVVWVGRSYGIDKYLTKTRTFENVKIEYPSGAPNLYISITSSFIDKDGIVWFGTFANGVWRYSYDEDVVRHQYIKIENNDEHPQRVNDILIDKHENIWICTDNGILTGRSWSSEFRKLTTDDGLPNNFIYAALEDDFGNVWFSTNKGISMLDVKSLKFRNYFVNDGLQGNEFNTGAYFKSKSGQLYFGGINGYTYFKPQKVNEKQKNYPFILNKVTTNKGNIEIEQNNTGEYSISLPRGTSFISVEFALLSYLNEKQNNYQYRNSKLGPEWIDLRHQNKLLIDQPASGSRIIEVRAKTLGGEWNENSLLIEVYKEPYYWEVWYFRVLIVLTILITVLIYMNRRIRKAKKVNAKLEELIAIRTGELQRAYEEVKSSNEAKDKLFSIIAHDLRNPLNSLMGFSSLLKNQSGSFNEDEKKEYIDVIYTSSNNLGNLMDNLLNWSRMQLNKIHPYFSDFSIKEILKSNLRFLDGHITQKKLSVRIPQFDDVKVYADTDMISVIIRNLLSNAIKYSHEDGILEINGISGDDNYFALSIRDDGIGMDEESISKIFSMKKISSVQGTNNEVGSGLGLILCHEFAIMNKCKLIVKSEKGKGSTFTIKIPIAD